MMKKLLKDKKSIKAWLDKYEVTNYTLIPDARYGFVVDGDEVYLDDLNLEHIEVQFNIVRGGFHCNHNRLKSLEGSPLSVRAEFDCSFNQLTTLQYSPLSVGGYFNCSDNKIISLLGAPNSIPAYFDCAHNHLKNLQHCPTLVTSGFYCDSNKINNLAYLPERAANLILINNPQLGVIQHMTNLSEIRENTVSHREKVFLSDNLTHTDSKKSVLKL